MESIGRYLNVDFTRRVVDALPARFTGPAKKKKPAQKPKNKNRRSPEEKAREKARQRHKNRKNVGKRRAPSAKKTAQDGGDDGAAKKDVKHKDGLAPLTRK